MQTVDKAMTLLGFFSTSQPEIGLSELSRISGIDKAAVRRLLVSLIKHGLVEQNPADRRYRLGPGVLHLARVREATRPIEAVIAPILSRLTDLSGETSHASVMAGDMLVTCGVSETNRANRVHVDHAERLPLHATASGFAYLAFCPVTRRDDILARSLNRFTSKTVTDPARLRERIDAARQTGVGVSEGGFEEEVTGAASPFFDAHGEAIGAIAVTTPTSRYTDEHEALLRSLLLNAAREVTLGMGGAVPLAFERLIETKNMETV